MIWLKKRNLPPLSTSQVDIVSTVNENHTKIGLNTIIKNKYLRQRTTTKSFRTQDNQKYRLDKLGGEYSNNTQNKRLLGCVQII